MPIKPTRTNLTKIYKENIPKQPRQTHQTIFFTLNNNRQHQIGTNPYLQSIIQPNQRSIYHEQPSTQPIVSQSPNPTSKVTTPSTTIQNTTPDTYPNLHRRRILTKEGSILINGNNNILTEEPEADISNNTVSFLKSTPIQTYRKCPIKPTTGLPGCNGSRDVTQNNNQPHQECMNPYYASTSSLTSKNTPIATHQTKQLTKTLRQLLPQTSILIPPNRKDRTLINLKYPPKSVTIITIKFLRLIHFQPEKN